MAHQAEGTSLETQLTNKIVKIPSSNVKLTESTILLAEGEIKWYFKGPTSQLWERQKQMSFQAQAIPALSETCSAQEHRLPRSTAGLCDTPAAQRWMWKGQSLLITLGLRQLNNYSRSCLDDWRFINGACRGHFHKSEMKGALLSKGKKRNKTHSLEPSVSVP